MAKCPVVKVRSIPIETVAWQYTGDITGMPDWVGKRATSRGATRHPGRLLLQVEVFGRAFTIRPGMWLIKIGSTIQMKSDAAFRASYQRMEDGHANV